LGSLPHFDETIFHPSITSPPCTTLESLQSENAPSATKEIPVRKVLRALQDVSDAQHINVVHASAMQHTVLQSDIAVEGSTNEMVGKGLMVATTLINNHMLRKIPNMEVSVAAVSSLNPRTQTTNTRYFDLSYLSYSFKFPHTIP
jgi:hypothetical protein